VSGKKPSMILCYEAGHDAFWLARFLRAHGIDCLVVDSASLQINRRRRRAKADRIDLGKLLRALIAWCGGERHVWSVVRIPSVDEEDLRRSHRERSRLITQNEPAHAQPRRLGAPGDPEQRFLLISRPLNRVPCRQ
jgi:transposase